MTTFKKSFWKGNFIATYWGLLMLGYALQAHSEVSHIMFTPVDLFRPPYKVHMRLRVFSSLKDDKGANLFAIIDIAEDVQSFIILDRAFVVLDRSPEWKEEDFNALLQSVGLHQVSSF